MTTPLQDSDIAAALELADGATPGEWRVGMVSGRCRKPSHGGRAHPGLRGPDPCDYEYTIVDGDEVSNCYVSIAPNITLIGSDDNGPILSEANARFIAAARTLVPALARECQRLREEVETQHVLVRGRDEHIWKLRAQLAAMEAERDGARAETATTQERFHAEITRHKATDAACQKAIDGNIRADALSRTIATERNTAYAERDAAIARAVAAEQELANVQAVAAVAACSRGDSLAETWRNVEANTAEKIAAWLDDTAWNDDGFDDDKGDISEQTAALIVADIRANAWRAKEEG